MLIECLIVREGPTTLNLAKTKYTFMPILRYDENGKRIEQTTSCCEVNSEEHVKYLLSRGQFREYKPENVSVPAKKNPLARYSFDKHLDGTANAGYIVVDSEKKRFGGSNGWQDERKGILPFTSEYEAFEWLKEEASGEVPEEEPEQEVAAKRVFKCKTCGEECANPRALGEHYKERHPTKE